MALACAGCCLLWLTPAQAAIDIDKQKYGHKFNNGEVYEVKDGESLDTVADNRGKITGKESGAHAYGLGYTRTGGNYSATIRGSLIQANSLAYGGKASGNRPQAEAEAYGLSLGTNATLTSEGAMEIVAESWGGTAELIAMFHSSTIKAKGSAFAYGINLDAQNKQLKHTGALNVVAEAHAGTAAVVTEYRAGAIANGWAYGITAEGTNALIDSTGGTVTVAALAYGGTATSVANSDGSPGVGADADARAIFANGAGKVNIDGDAVVLVQAVSGTAQATKADGDKPASAKADATGRGLAAFGGEIKVTGTTAVDLLAQGGTATSAGSGASARTRAYGVYASNISGATGKIELQGDAVIRVQALGGTASGKEGSNTNDATAMAQGLSAYNGGKIELKGDAVIQAQATGGTLNGAASQAYAYSLRAVTDTTNTTGNPTSQIDINTDGKHAVQLTGDVYAAGKGTINLTLAQEGSFLQGNVVTIAQRSGSSTSSTEGTVNLTVSDGAVWRPVYDNRNGSFFDRSEYESGKVSSNDYQTTVNSIKTLTLQNGGLLDLTWDDPARGSAWRSMEIKEFTGQEGIARINSDIANNTGDSIKIDGVKGESASLGIQIGYDPATQKGYGTYLGQHTVLTGDGAENVAVYGVMTESGAHAYMPIVEGAKITGLKVAPSTNIRSAGNAVYSALQLGTAVSKHLQERLGELRDGSESGIWARVYNGSAQNDSYDNIKTDYKGVQGGYDRAFAENGGTGRIGGAFSYADSDVDLARGGGSGRAYDFALYKTWQGAQGHYYDLVLHYGKADLDYHTTDLSRHYQKASFDASTLGVTAEYGCRMMLADGWYWQPQAEVSWFRLGSADYTASNGMQVAQDSAVSLCGRLGIGVGRKLRNGTHYYVTLSGVHEFDGEVGLHGDGASYRQDYGGSWGEFVLGVTAPIDKLWDGYASAERCFGGAAGNSWQLNAGVRLRF